MAVAGAKATSGATEIQVHREYKHASRSIAPWFTHKRMVPKWTGLVLMGALTFAFPAPLKPILFVVGLAMFFPSEYVVHRGVFHYFADKSAGKVLSKQHVEHHKRPDDLDYLFNDPRISLTVGFLYFIVCFGITRNLGQSAALSLGNFTGLLYYEHVHFAAHRPGSRPWTPWSRFMKKFHLWHHFKHERKWFGVTSPAFDHAFGSNADPATVEHSPTVRTLVPTDEQQEWMRR
ncbi:MAG TPA: sterol desaturase family protein [Candidatus Thermoplasmatota archaeon]|nr:sterol desaturase family protein [Candidatus Thermoplasmatota archaeon]